MNDKIFTYIGEQLVVSIEKKNSNSVCDYYCIHVTVQNYEYAPWDSFDTITHGFNGYTRAEIIGRMFYLMEQKFPVLAWYEFGEPEWFDEWQHLTVGLMNYPE